MPTFGKRGSRVRIYLRGRIWHSSYRFNGREITKSLDTTDEVEASAAAIAKSEDIRKRGHSLAKRGEMVLYVIRRGDDGPVKIGISRNVMQRIGQLKETCPEHFTIIACYKMRDVEQALHARLKEFQIEGEWFRPEALEDLMWFFSPVEKPRKLLRVVR